jgi:hypothetical protein
LFEKYDFTNKISIIFLDACGKSIDRNKERAKVLVQLISMAVQLKYLIINNFQWLLHVIEYVRIYSI